MADTNSLFRRFEENLRMPSDTVKTVQDRYHRITKRLNKEFWNNSSEVANSLYVGSYGRGTAISTSDIDILFTLPNDLYTRYFVAQHLGSTNNMQSGLLQKVKNSLAKTYPMTKLRGDGQVVVLDFCDGIRFEVVPVFRKNSQELIYPDTHYGGSWKTMSPKVELQAFNELAQQQPDGLKKFCRMLRAWNLTHSSPLSGQIIDAMAYAYWNQSGQSSLHLSYNFDIHTFLFFSFWIDKLNSNYSLLFAPGTNRQIQVPNTDKVIKLISTSQRYALDAIFIKDHNTESWRLIFGTKFPSA